MITEDIMKNYSDVARITNISKFYEINFNAKPVFYVRSPGRINLIGEHIDYSGYSVFPMAINQDILFAVGYNTINVLEVLNMNSFYRSLKKDMNSISIQREEFPWWNYLICPIIGLQEKFSDKTFIGMNIAVEGNIPPNAGLSSSSALVCTSALATCFANKIEINKECLAFLCAKFEQLIGIFGGGMDQAVSLLAKEGYAKLISFNPLKALDVTLPEDGVFVVVNSLIQINKASNNNYNSRVLDCKLATKLLCFKNKIPENLPNLFEVQKFLKLNLKDFLMLLQTQLHIEPYSKNELCHELNMSLEDLEAIFPENTKKITSFKLWQRASHVVSVNQFVELCQSGASDAVYKLGQLMFDSHNSCKILYDCSHPKLDELVELSKSLCFGARLTGAGWGGCIIALISKQNIRKYKEKIFNEYFKSLPAAQEIPEKDYLFVTKAGTGAFIFLHGNSL